MLKVRSSRMLKHKIRMSGFSIKGLAINIGRSPYYITNVVNGKSSPSASTALMIVNTINISLDTNDNINDYFFDTSVKKTITKVV